MHILYNADLCKSQVRTSDVDVFVCEYITLEVSAERPLQCSMIKVEISDPHLLSIFSSVGRNQALCLSKHRLFPLFLFQNLLGSLCIYLTLLALLRKIPKCF